MCRISLTLGTREPGGRNVVKQKTGELTKNPNLEADGKAEKNDEIFNAMPARLKRRQESKRINITLGDERG